MDPTNTIDIDTRDDLENRCCDILVDKREKVFKSIKKECVDILVDLYSRHDYDYFGHSPSQYFYNIYEKNFKKEFGEYLEKGAGYIFYSCSKHLEYFCDYIGWKNINKLKKEFSKFLDLQLNDENNLFVDLTDPLYDYLIEHNGILPESLREQEEEQEGNPN
jgi:hypothetical protein